jgi:hypothetical protein
MTLTTAGNILVGATAARGGVSTKMLVSSVNSTNYFEIQNTSGAGASGDADVLFSSGSTGAYGLVGYNFTNNALRFFANSSERMRITSAGDVGIGTSSPSFKLSVNGTGSTYIGVISTAGGSGSGLYTSNATNGYFIGAGAASGGSGLEFRDATNSSTRMVINSNGTIQTISTISVGNATPSTSGAGITFPATQSASSDANTLDDYEEGTVNLFYSDGTNNSATSAAAYVKIGGMCWITGDLYAISLSGLTAGAQVRIAGLPFQVTVKAFSSIVGAITSNNPIMCYPISGQTYAQLYQTANGSDINSLVKADFASGNASTWFQFAYRCT